MINVINILIFISLFIQFSSCQDYVFSIIISIYNTARYLNDSLDSVLQQTFDIKKIQIILINDGSTDETEKICLIYKERYPNNIIYIKTEHNGVSKARNIGLKFARGKYINFLDSDDKWDKKAFNYVLLFFQFYRKVNIIGCRLKFFEALESYHPLDYKFYKTRVANLTEEYNCIHLMASSTFFRLSLIKNKKFKEGVFTGEDTIFINTFLLLNPILGFIREAIYFYRKRADSTSAVQNAVKNEDYYLSIIKSVDEYLIEKSKKLHNRIVPFIQFYLGYSILFRIAFPAYKYLKKDDLYKYYELIQNIIIQIEDIYILEQRVLTLKEKFVALSKKYHRDLREDITIQKNNFIYHGKTLMNIKQSRNILIWRMLDIKNDQIQLEGKDNCILKKDKYFYFCQFGNKKYYPTYFDYSVYDLITIYGNLEKGRIVVFNIPLENMNYHTLKFFLSYNGNEFEIFPSFGWFSHISNIFNSYYCNGGYIVKNIHGRLNIYQYEEKLKQSSEKEFCEQLNKIKKNNIIKLRNDYFKFETTLKDSKVETWIINDKKNLARDNGEYFFRFLKKINPKNIHFYFVIQKDCYDYTRLKSLGNILELGSDYYLNIFLKTDKIISSVHDTWVYNPFNNERKYLIDLFHFDFIYIQNGIIKDDLSKYLNRITTNFSLIITSSVKEYNSIIDYEYHYNLKNVILTGLPRYDNLKSLQPKVNTEKIILIFPTWRRFIKGTFNTNSYQSIYSYSFTSSDYFNFYNSLINNEQVIINMIKYKYRGIFCLHPYFSKQWKDFKQNDVFSVIEFCDYQKLILKSSLLITDYSSVSFDFAFLKKPIIYIQFDYEEYRNNHFPNGYFDYIKDGFGIVCFDLQCIIKEISFALKNHCLIDNIYLKRINRFFKYDDDKNCERLFFNLLNNFYIHNNKKNNNFVFVNIFLFTSILIKIINKNRK